MAVALRTAFSGTLMRAAPIVLQEIADAVQSITQGAALDIQRFWAEARPPIPIEPTLWGRAFVIERRADIGRCHPRGSCR
jgi:hypothetical protein